jgi:flagellar biosynthesis chaperone FliJ
MSQRAFEVLLKMLAMRKDRSVARSKRAQAEFLRAKDFSDQLQTYAKEYQTQWLQTAEKGDSVLMMQTASSFGRQLADTAAGQQAQALTLGDRSQQAVQQALHDTQREKTLKDYLLRQRQLRSQSRDKREQRELEDVLNARNRKP